MAAVARLLLAAAVLAAALPTALAVTSSADKSALLSFRNTITQVRFLPDPQLHGMCSLQLLLPGGYCR